MKKQTFAIIALLVMSIVITVSQTYAQNQILRVKIPFAFSVNNKVLPSGTYVIRRATDNGSIWTLQSPSQKTRMFLMVKNLSGTNDSSNPRLTFRRYGSRSFLADFKTISYRVSLPKSRSEKNLQRESESNLAKNAEPENVTIEVALN